MAELQHPGRDPRDELPKPLLRTDIMGIESLTAGMELTGTVRNVVDFGAFVDIGVHQDGLVHISEVCNRRLKHPSEMLKVGDIVTDHYQTIRVERMSLYGYPIPFMRYQGTELTKQGVPKKRQPVPCNPAFQNYVESINGEPYKYVEEKI